jgi:hypothetical protein
LQSNYRQTFIYTNKMSLSQLLEKVEQKFDSKPMKISIGTPKASD